jgi:hypothetical protein
MPIVGKTSNAFRIGSDENENRNESAEKFIMLVAIYPIDRLRDSDVNAKRSKTTKLLSKLFIAEVFMLISLLWVSMMIMVFCCDGTLMILSWSLLSLIKRDSMFCGASEESRWILLSRVKCIWLYRGFWLINGCEEASHVKREVSDRVDLRWQTVIVSNAVNRSKVNALLSRIGSNVTSNLLQQVEYLPATKVCRRSPLLRPRVSEEDLCKIIEVNTVSAETMATFVLRKLDDQVSIPYVFP